jgi:hypothetical protein
MLLQRQHWAVPLLLVNVGRDRSALFPPASVVVAGLAWPCLHAARPPFAAGSHDNVVGLRGLCSRGPHLYLVMELCPR